MSKENSLLEDRQDNHHFESNTELNKQDVIDLLYYVEVIAKHWKMILKTTAVAAIMSAIIAVCLPNIYKSTTKILPPQQDSGLMGMIMGSTSGIGSMAADLLGKGSPADLYVGMLNSETISDLIINKFKLMDVYKEKYRYDTYKSLSDNVDISAGKKDGIIVISVEDEDPKRAAQIANAYVDELNKLLIKLNVMGANQNKTFLEEQLAKARLNLTKAEDALKTFQSKNKALDITEQAKGTLRGIADLEGQLATEEIKLSGIRRVYTESSQETKNQLAVIANIKKQIAKFEGDRPNKSILGIGLAPELGQQYLRLMREFKIQETLVEIFTKQYEITKLSEAKSTDTIQVIQVAHEPDKKSKPRRSLIVLASAFFAGFGAVLYAFIREASKQMHPEVRERWKRIRASFSCTTIFSIRHNKSIDN